MLDLVIVFIEKDSFGAIFNKNNYNNQIHNDSLTTTMILSL